MKGRNEKKTLASFQPSHPIKANSEKSPVSSSTTTTATVSQSDTKTVNQYTVADVHHDVTMKTELTQTNKTTLVASQNSQKLTVQDQLTPTESQNSLTGIKSGQQVTTEATAASSQQDGSSDSLDNQKETKQSASENTVWHVAVESTDSQNTSHEITMEEAIAQLMSHEPTRHHQETVMKEDDSQNVTQLSVQLVSLQQQQEKQSKVNSVDTVQTPTGVPSQKDTFLNSTQLQSSSDVKQIHQESFDAQVMSHQVTMEKPMTQITITADTKQATEKSDTAINTPVVSKQPVATNVDDQYGSLQAVDSKQDLDFPDDNFASILNDLLELSGEVELSQTTTAAKKKQATDSSAEYHTLSLFSDVPITAPPPKPTTVHNKPKNEPVRLEPVRLEPVRLEPVRLEAITAKKPLTTSSANNNIMMAATTRDSTKQSTVVSTTNKPSEVSVAKREHLPATVVTTKEPTKSSVAMNTNTTAGKHNVPLAISHKHEMQQQKDGMDLEWEIDMGDIDSDLAFQLEELSSIIGQLGGIAVFNGVCVNDIVLL